MVFIREKLKLSLHEKLLEVALAKVEAGVTSLGEVMQLGLSLPWDNE